ncbi:unnamed protein product, partial [Cylicostephanus goldi]
MPAELQSTTSQPQARTPVSIYEMQHWLRVKGGEYIRVTEDTKADAEREPNSYEPKYIDRKTQPKFQLGRTDTYKFEIDAMGPGGIQQLLARHEDELDVPIEYVRTLTYDFEAGKRVDDTALVAKHAQGTLNVDPMSGDDIAPIKFTCTGDEMATYQLKKSPTLPIEIDGKTYELALGNFTFILDARTWLKECESLQSITDTDEVMDALEALSERARIMIESAVGKNAAQELIGEAHRLDLYRIMDVMNILA